MKKLLLFVIMCTLGIFTANAQNRLESITKAYEGDNITYVYEEGTNNVVKILKGVASNEGNQYVTFLQYENGVLVKTEYTFAKTDATINDIDKSSYSAEWDAVEYTYSEGRLVSYKDLQYRNWYSYTEPWGETEYTLVYDGDKVTSITFEGSSNNTRITYEYENDRLVRETKLYFSEWAEPEPGDVVEYSIEYVYDEAGNCTSATKYTHYNGKTPSETTEYIYDETKLATNIYCFTYPHEVKPVNTNIIAKASTYGYYADWIENEETGEWEQGEPVKGEATETIYNYSFATIAKPLAPAGLTAEVLSDTEVKLMWDVVADAASYNVYNGTELAGTTSNATYTVTGLTAETEYTFTVTAANEGGESGASNAVKVKTLKAVEITPAAVAFGEVTLGGNYWLKAGATREVSVATFGKEVKSIAVDNAFFTLNYEITANPILLNVGYDVNGAEGAQEGVITVTLTNDATYTIPVTATAYTPVTPDIFELAQEITFTDGVYTNKPDFATLHDNYSGAPDAVYTFTLNENEAVEVKVTGTNGKYAIYSEEGGFETIIERKEKILETTFSYDFNDGSLDDFIVEDYDEYKDYTWELEEDGDGYRLISDAHLAAYEGEEYVTYIGAADERIFTKKAYPITEHSVLAMDINTEGQYGPFITVEVTKDGKNFTELAVVGPEPLEGCETPTAWLPKKVNIGAKLLEAGLELGEYQISLYHKEVAGGHYDVDNLSLTERGLVYPAGKYYLVASAEDEFTVDVKSVVYTGNEVIEPVIPVVPAAPVVTAEATTTTTVVLTWNAVEYAESYNVYQGEKRIAEVTAPATTYTVENLTPETEYTFIVKAVSEAGESEASNVVKVTTLAELQVPAAPVVTVVDVTESTIVFTWNKVEGAESYNIYAYDEFVGGLSDTIAGFNMLEPNTKYCFTVTAVNAAGESAHSAEVCATTLGEGIEENTASFNIYPNPVNDVLFIETEAEVEEVSIFDVYGRNQNLRSSETQNLSISVDVANLNSGVYFVKVVTNEGEVVKRFVKK